jgi:protein-S-isoprenylcysteine O-methyltransferase Ste14
VAAVFEERDLVSHFGRQYAEYRRRVPMFVPRLAVGEIATPQTDAAESS